MRIHCLKFTNKRHQVVIVLILQNKLRWWTREADSYTDLKEEGYHSNAILSEVIKLSSDIPQANFAVDDVHLQGEPPTLHGVL